MRRRAVEQSPEYKRRGNGPGAYVSGSERRRLLSPRLRRAAVLIGWCATLGAVAWGLRYLEGHVRGLQAGQSCRLVWEDLPAWLMLTENEWVLKGRDGIEAAAGLRPEDDLHDPHLCERIGRGLSGSPWVAEVRRVVKRPDGVVGVRAVFREPAAYVERRGRAYLIDGTRRLLPVECAADVVRRDEWFVITGVARPPPAAPGQVWEGNDLAAGLKLVEFLRKARFEGRLPFRSSLKAIDVSNATSRDTLLWIHTIYPGCYIEWGLPPGEEDKVDTSSASRKLDLLNSVYASHGRLPERILGVRWKEGIEYREPRKH